MTTQDISRVYSLAHKGAFTLTAPCIGLIYLDNYTKACTLFKNKEGHLVCCLPYSTATWLDSLEELHFLTSYRHITWQLPKQD